VRSIKWSTQIRNPPPPTKEMGRRGEKGIYKRVMKRTVFREKRGRSIVLCDLIGGGGGGLSTRKMETGEICEGKVHRSSEVFVPVTHR